LSGSSPTTFNQLYKGSVFEFLVHDKEGDTPTVTHVVKYKSAALADGDSPFTVDDSSAPKYIVMYDPADFSGKIAADADSATNTQYEIVITAIDDESDDTATTYTITAIIVNDNHKPYIKDDSVTDLGSWIIGHEPGTMPTIPTSLWKDDDPSDELAFDSATVGKCTFV